MSFINSFFVGFAIGLWGTLSYIIINYTATNFVKQFKKSRTTEYFPLSNEAEDILTGDLVHLIGNSWTKKQLSDLFIVDKVSTDEKGIPLYTLSSTEPPLYEKCLAWKSQISLISFPQEEING